MDRSFESYSCIYRELVTLLHLKNNVIPIWILNDKGDLEITNTTRRAAGLDQTDSTTIDIGRNLKLAEEKEKKQE